MHSSIFTLFLGATAVTASSVLSKRTAADEFQCGNGLSALCCLARVTVASVLEKTSGICNGAILAPGTTNTYTCPQSAAQRACCASKLTCPAVLASVCALASNTLGVVGNPSNQILLAEQCTYPN